MSDGGGSRNSARVRDHLANERTYLAWMRTSIALMGFGVVIVRLRYLLPAAVQGHTHGWMLGLLFALFGLVTVGLSTAQYFAVRRAIEAESYQPSSRWVLLFSLAIAILGAGVLYVLLSTPVSVHSDVP
jgi:putative membrane protein